MYSKFLGFLGASLILIPSVQSAQVNKRACLPAGVNAATIDLITNDRFDGYEDEPYDDGTGRITVGYGHMCTSSTCSEVPYPTNPLSEVDGHVLVLMIHY
jgi:lysozyme